MPIPPNVTPRLKIDRAKARAALAGDPQLANATDAEVDAALAGIDQDAEFDKQRAGWRPEVWDKVSPINDVPAEHYLARDDVKAANGDIYLIRNAEGRVVLFQPHDPDLPGFTKFAAGKALERATRHADDIAADITAGVVNAKVRANIRAARGLPPA